MDNVIKAHARAYDKEVKPKSFKEGDLVLKKIMPFKEDPKKRLNLTMRVISCKQRFCQEELCVCRDDGEPVNLDSKKDIFYITSFHSLVEMKLDNLSLSKCTF